jgi:hypothetical protein
MMLLLQKKWRATITMDNNDGRCRLSQQKNVCGSVRRPSDFGEGAVFGDSQRVGHIDKSQWMRFKIKIYCIFRYQYFLILLRNI